MTWSAPDNTGPAVSDYDVRYFQGSADPADPADWIEADDPGGHDHTGTETTATIADLPASTAYRAQVRATSDEGTSPWSAAGSGRTNEPNATAPDAPTAVTVASAADGRGVAVAWAAPENDNGADIAGYDVR